MTTEDLTRESPQWPDVQALQDRFPSLPIRVISGILIESRRSVDMFGLTPAEEDAMVEKIAIEQMLQSTGQSEALAPPRLDPETHSRRLREEIEPPVGA